MSKVKNTAPRATKTKLSRAIDDLIYVDTTDDLSFLEKSDQDWDTLSQLKDELAEHTAIFVSQVGQVVCSPLVVHNLGKTLNKFKSTVDIFERDMTNFSEKIKQNRLRHEGKTGKIKSMEDYDLYNQISIEYHTLYQDLHILISPVVSEIMLMSLEARDNLAKLTKETGEENAEPESK